MVVFSPILGIRVRASTFQHILTGVGGSRKKKRDYNGESETKKAGRSACHTSGASRRRLHSKRHLCAESSSSFNFPWAGRSVSARELMPQLTRRPRRHRPRQSHTRSPIRQSARVEAAKRLIRPASAGRGCGCRHHWRDSLFFFSLFL